MKLDPKVRVDPDPEPIESAKSQKFRIRKKFRQIRDRPGPSGLRVAAGNRIRSLRADRDPTIDLD